MPIWAAAVGSAIEQIEADPEMRVAVLTGAGSAFSAGADPRRSPPGNR